MTDKLATKWNVRYQFSKSERPEEPVAAQVLLEQKHFLSEVLPSSLPGSVPNEHRALDMACGRGGNARFLNECGFKTTAWDISGVAIEELSVAVPEVEATVRDVVKNPPEAESFDVIVVSRFLDRSSCRAIEAALRPGGVLFYQTFTQGLSNPDYLLKPNELLTMFPSLHVAFYSEPLGGNEAQLVGRKARALVN